MRLMYMYTILDVLYSYKMQVNVLRSAICYIMRVSLLEIASSLLLSLTSKPVVGLTSRAYLGIRQSAVQTNLVT